MRANDSGRQNHRQRRTHSTRWMRCRIQGFMPQSRAFRDLHDLKDEAAGRRVTWWRKKFRSLAICCRP